MATLNPNQIQKLGEKNYESWKIQVRSLLIYNELWAYTNGTELKTEQNAVDWTKKDEKALALILLSVEESQLNHVKRAQTSLEAWENLQKVHESRGPVRRAALYKQLHRMKKETHQTMTQYVNDFQYKVEQLEEVGLKIPDELVSIMLLSSLPAEYENFAIAIESRDQLPNLESLKIKLIEEEARRGETCDAADQDQNNALVTKKKYKNTKFKEKQFKFNGNCNVCKKYGHRAKECRFKHENVTQKRSDSMTAIAFKSHSKKANVWYLDSCATMHMSNQENKFTNIEDYHTEIYTVTDESVNSIGKGQIEMKVNVFNKHKNDIKLSQAVLVPSFKNNLLSVSQITKKGYKIIFDSHGAKVRRRDGTVAMTAKEENGLYVVEENATQNAMLHVEHYNPLIKWHHRLGHLNFNDVRKLKNKQTVIGINDKLNTSNPVCEVCQKGKIHQLPYESSTRGEKDILGLIHSDICGPFSTASLGGAKYFITFIDDKSRYVYIKTLKKRSEALDAFKEYKARVEKQTNQKIKKLRTDNGTEYCSKEFNDFLRDEGIARELTVEYTPQQNGVSERSNRTLVEMARCMLIQANLPISLWAEAINTAAYIRNRCPTKANKDASPYEIWTGKKPYIGFMRKFGSRVIALEKGRKRNKFEPKGKEYILVGYSDEAKAYRLWEQGTRTVFKRRDVRFIEDQNTTTYKSELQLFEAPMNLETPKAMEEESLSENDVDTESTSEENDLDKSQAEPVCEEPPIEIDTPNTSRASGRPKIERTGKRGRPRKIYNTKSVQEEPTTVQEAMDGTNQDK